MELSLEYRREPEPSEVPAKRARKQAKRLAEQKKSQKPA